MSNPACHNMRQSLGVYVVGALDPAERMLVDLHLAGGRECREELAGLALPGLLGRVPARDAERVILESAELRDLEEPPAELLARLLKEVAARRATGRWRGILAAAAAVIFAIGSGVAGAHFLIPGGQSPAPITSGSQVVSASNPITGVAATVSYRKVTWGTSIDVKVSGVPAGISCTMWAVNADGKRFPALAVGESRTGRAEGRVPGVLGAAGAGRGRVPDLVRRPGPAEHPDDLALARPAGNARPARSALSLVTAGIIVAVAVLALATATGLLYRVRNGTMRPARPAAGGPAGAAPAGPGLTTAELGGAARRAGHAGAVLQPPSASRAGRPGGPRRGGRRWCPGSRTWRSTRSPTWTWSVAEHPAHPDGPGPRRLGAGRAPSLRPAAEGRRHRRPGPGDLTGAREPADRVHMSAHARNWTGM